MQRKSVIWARSLMFPLCVVKDKLWQHCLFWNQVKVMTNFTMIHVSYIRGIKKDLLVDVLCVSINNDIIFFLLSNYWSRWWCKSNNNLQLVYIGDLMLTSPLRHHRMATVDDALVKVALWCLCVRCKVSFSSTCFPVVDYYADVLFLISLITSPIHNYSHLYTERMMYVYINIW